MDPLKVQNIIVAHNIITVTLLNIEHIKHRPYLFSFLKPLPASTIRDNDFEIGIDLKAPTGPIQFCEDSFF